MAALGIGNDQIRWPPGSFPILLFNRFYLFIFRARRREGEREGGKQVASRTPPSGGNGVPDRESKQGHFSLQACQCLTH